MYFNWNFLEIMQTSWVFAQQVTYAIAIEK